LFEPYIVMKFVHVVAAIAWVGGGLVLTMLTAQVRKDGTADELAALMGRIERFGKVFFAPLSVVVLVMGVGMGVMGGIMAAPWVSIGFLGIFISAGLGMGYLTPTSRKLRGLIQQHGLAHPEVRRLGDQMLLVSRIDIVILMLIVAVMVFKPGAV
jgi:uncharacterized membrane protein